MYSRNKSSIKGDSHLTNRFDGKLSAMLAGCFGLKHCEGNAWRMKYFCICVNMGAYNCHSTKNFEIFETGTNGTEKFQKIRKLLSFRKANHSTLKFRKFQDESEMGRKFPGKIFPKFGYTSWGCPLLWNLCRFPIFYSALASSFGRDHSELDISLVDDAHLIKETL